MTLKPMIQIVADDQTGEVKFKVLAEQATIIELIGVVETVKQKLIWKQVSTQHQKVLTKQYQEIEDIGNDMRRQAVLEKKPWYKKMMPDKNPSGLPVKNDLVMQRTEDD